MEMSVHRSQSTGLFGHVQFAVTVQVSLDHTEQLAAQRYGLLFPIVYTTIDTEMRSDESELLWAIRLLVAELTGQIVRLEHFRQGVSFAAQSITEILQIEEQITSSLQTIEASLLTSSNYFGQEIRKVGLPGQS